jgi:Adenylate kinase
MLSPPGAGKGAHASQLSHATGVAYISSGALPRAEIARGGDLGRRFAQYTSRSDLRVFEGQRRGRLPTGGALAGGVELLQGHEARVIGAPGESWP